MERGGSKPLRMNAVTRCTASFRKQSCRPSVSRQQKLHNANAFADEEYWYASPCSRNNSKCLSADTCHDEERVKNLEDRTLDVFDCHVRKDETEEYQQTRCKRANLDSLFSPGIYVVHARLYWSAMWIVLQFHMEVLWLPGIRSALSKAAMSW